MGLKQNGFDFIAANKSKEVGKDKESIQSSTTPDVGHHMGK